MQTRTVRRSHSGAAARAAGIAWARRFVRAAAAAGSVLLVGVTGTASAQAPAGAATMSTAAGTAPSLLAQAAIAARIGPQQVDAVEVELIARTASLRAGEPVELGLRLRHAPHWHTYWRNPGDSGLATQLAPVGPEGTRFDPLRWPAPQRLWVGPLANYGYEGEVVLPFAATVPRAETGSAVRFEAFAQWLMCKDVCIPGEARIALELPVRGDGEASGPSRHAALFELAARTIPDDASPIAARLHRDGGGLALAFEADRAQSTIARAEFFPYEPGIVAAPAPQPLLRTASGWRLDLALADGAAVPNALTGLLVADGRAVSVQARADAAPAPAGAPVSVAERPPAGAWSAASVPLDAAGLALALVSGVLGGLILNLMPCVFPVVGLKVMGFARSAHGADATRAMRRAALAFGAGVILSFWVLGGLLIALRAAGEAVGWGFQLQAPGFVAAMALLFVAVGLNFSGVFEFGASLTRLGGVGGDSTAGAFGAGVLAVLVATPCTAPFMGSALGFTLAQPALVTLAVFTAIGLGMAAPYVVLGFVPAWLRVLPRPGRWMETLRQALAFPMYATAAWLAWVLAQQAGADAVFRLLLAAVAIAAAAWAWGRFAAGSPRRPAIAWATATVGVALAAGLIAPVATTTAVATDATTTASPAAPSDFPWEPWSDRRVEAALAAGRPVFVDFTAAWCVTCQANKKLVLERDAVVDEMRRLGVVALRADWTQRDPRITEALAKHGRNGVPLYLVYRAGGGAPRVLPELLTPALVIEALRGI
jgi:thiol:disulfide interchange protein DsbD